MTTIKQIPKNRLLLISIIFILLIISSYAIYADSLKTDLTILNPQSYPELGGNWTVEFKTTGTSDLIITAVNGTEFGKDLDPIEIICDNNIVNYERIDNSIFIPSYSCPDTSYEISRVMTTGKHHLSFQFGDIVDYANNFVADNITFVSPTLSTDSYTDKNWTYINITSAEDFNNSLIEWGDSSGYSNISMSNSTKTNWYKNITSLSDYAYNYTIFAQNTTNSWIQTSTRFITVDTTKPEIDFVNPTDTDNAYISKTYTYINTTISDTNKGTSLIDWNNSLVGWWRFDNSSDFTDHSTYTNNANNGDGKTSDSTYTEDGKFGGARYFDGDGDYIDCGSGSSLNLPDDFSVIAWIKTGSCDSQYIVTNYDGPPAMPYGFGLSIDDTSGHAYFSICDNTAICTDVESTTSVCDDMWYLIIGVRDTSADKLYIYIDGIKEDDTEDMTPSENTIATSHELDIGALNAWNGPQTTFTGTIDDVRIYNRSLSPEEINASYNSGLYRLETNFTSLSDGIYTYTAHTQDLAGNTNQTTRTLTVDTTPPIYENITQSSNPIDADNQQATITIDVEDTLTPINLTYIEYNNTNYTMTFTAGNTYTHDINLTIPENITYRFYIGNELDLINQTEELTLQIQNITLTINTSDTVSDINNITIEGYATLKPDNTSLNNINISIYFNDNFEANATTNATGFYTYTVYKSAGEYTIKVNTTDNNISGQNETTILVKTLIFDIFYLKDSSDQYDNILYGGEPFNLSARIREYNGTDYTAITSGTFTINITFSLTYSNSKWQTSQTYTTANETIGTYNIITNITGTASTGTYGLTEATYTYYVKNISITIETPTLYTSIDQTGYITGKLILLPDDTEITSTAVDLYRNTTYISSDTSNADGNYSNSYSHNITGSHNITVNTTRYGINASNSTTIYIKIPTQNPSAIGITTGTDTINLGDTVNLTVRIPQDNLHDTISEVKAEITNPDNVKTNITMTGLGNLWES